MKIVQMINALRVGGAEKLIITFAGAIQNKDIELVVITLRQNVPSVQKEVEDLGARVVAFNHRKIYAPNRFLEMLNFMRRSKPDVIHTHLSMANILGATSGYLAGVPVVTTLHNTKMSTTDNKFVSSMETFLLQHTVQKIIAVGWQTAEVHQPRMGKQIIEVIPNAVPLLDPLPNHIRNEMRVKLVGDPNLMILLSVSRLEPQKGVFDLLESFCLVHERYPTAQLVIAGSGSLEAEMKSRIYELGLKEFVHMLGLRQDIPELMAASDIFVSAAHWEGLPVASLEAMAAGLPLVVTSVGDLPRVIIPGTGILVEPQNPSALAGAVLNLIDDPDRREHLGRAARAHIEDNYSANVWAGHLLDIYTQANQTKFASSKRLLT